jgi:hypothetical protein
MMKNCIIIVRQASRIVIMQTQNNGLKSLLLCFLSQLKAIQQLIPL